MARKYEHLVTFILKNVGGKDNVDNVTHCMTRLRFKLKDESLVNETALKDHKEIITAQSAGGKYQVVIGTHVGDVYEEVLTHLGDKKEEKKEEVSGGLLNRFTAVITQTILPAMGFMVPSAMILAVLNLLLVSGIVKNGDGAQILLSSIGNTGLTFLPVAIGYTSAKYFKMNPILGMLLGSILIFPGVVESINSGDILYTLFDGSAQAIPVYKTFFGIPILFPASGYSSTIIPIIFATFVTSKIERFFKKVLPQSIQQMLLGFCTIGVGAIITFLVVGPVSVLLNGIITIIVDWLFSVSRILAIAVVALIYQPLVIFGLHWPLFTISMLNVTTYGFDGTLAPAIFPASFAHLGACLAVYLRSKSLKAKSIAFPAFFSATFCIIEPSFYGVTLPVKKRFKFCMFAGLVGGMILGLTNTIKYPGPMGILGYISFIDPNAGNLNGVFIAIIASIVAIAIAFALTWITYKPGEDGYDDDMEVKAISEDLNNVIQRKEIIYSPIQGEVKALSAMHDAAFANGGIGKGICIVPSEGKVIAPCDGVLTTLFPTGHALGITSNHGAEILVHIGANMVQISEDLFKKHKNQGDTVKKGDVLITFDLEKLKKKNYETEIAVIITNTSDYLDIVNVAGKNIDYQDELLLTVVSEHALKQAQVVA